LAPESGFVTSSAATGPCNHLYAGSRQSQETAEERLFAGYKRWSWKPPLKSMRAPVLKSKSPLAMARTARAMSAG